MFCACQIISSHTVKNKNKVINTTKKTKYIILQNIVEMIEITCNDRLGKKVRVKCNPDDTVGDLKKLIAAQTGTRWDKIILKKWYTTFKDHIQLQDCILLK